MYLNKLVNIYYYRIYARLSEHLRFSLSFKYRPKIYTSLKSPYESIAKNLKFA